MDISAPLTSLGSFVSKLAKTLKFLEILTIRDLIFYFPFRYDDLSKIVHISDCAPRDRVTIKGKVQFIRNFRSKVKHMQITEALVADGTGSMRLIWFNQSYLAKIIHAGDEYFFSGEPNQDKIGLQFVNPIYEAAKEVTTHTGRIVPIYPLTHHLTEKQLRAAIKLGLGASEGLKDWVPPHILGAHNLLDLYTALINIHFPASYQHLQASERRIKFNKLFLIQLANATFKSELAVSKAAALTFNQKEVKNFVLSLPFQLTTAQRKAAWEILKDTVLPKPMNRLLNGDVGSGKTIVAAIGIINAYYNHRQSAFLAPTEILALQHFSALCNVFIPYKMSIALLTGQYHRIADAAGSGNVTKTELKKRVARGEIDLVIGTHALLEADLEFSNLVFAVVDEQHRFGVNQRHLLRNKAARHGILPHFLSMTATPIPRTLALTLYGDLDISILDEMPPGRKTIQTRVARDFEKKHIYAHIQNEIIKGRQVFCICPLIDPSDILGAKSVKEVKEYLERDIFPKARIALLHGKMKSAEKEKVMKEFRAHDFDILVSTSVVEVGVDVPNASVMMIEGAERFGLAQLHQFRGRVGRGDHQSYCFLFTNSKNPEAYKRLHILEVTNNGFALAEKDLEIRGSGDLFGNRQWGFEDDQFLDLSDIELIKICRDVAAELMTQDKTLARWPALKEKFTEFMKDVHLE